MRPGAPGTPAGPDAPMRAPSTPLRGREEPEEPDGFDGPPADAGLPDEGFAADSGIAAGASDFEPALDAGDGEAAWRATPSADALGASPAVLFDRLRSHALDLDRPRHASLEHAECGGLEGHQLRIVTGTSFHAERLRSRTQELESIAKRLFGRPITIRIEQQSARPEALESAQSRERSRRRRQEALNSESVNLAIEILDAEIVEIRPLGDDR